MQGKSSDSSLANGNAPKLQLGCFDQALDGWTNTDVTPHLFVARVPGLASMLWRMGLMAALRYDQHRQGIFRRVRYMNVTKRFPFRDSSFAFVYTSHMLEHLAPSDAEFCLREVNRVLRPGGVLRILVPDLDDLVRRFRPDQADHFVEELFESRQKNAKNRHHWHYNETSLSGLLRAVGFADVQRCAFRQGRCPDLDRLDIRPQSLFVEATR